VRLDLELAFVPVACAQRYQYWEDDKAEAEAASEADITALVSSMQVCLLSLGL
jgi:hypothetical protein